MRGLLVSLTLGLLPPVAGCLTDPGRVRALGADPTARHLQTLDTVQHKGAVLAVEAGVPGKPVVSADLHGLRRAPVLLASLGPLTRLRSLNLYQTAFTDADLQRLRGLPALESLNLNATRVTDAGLPSLRTLPALQELDLNDTRVSDAGLAALAGLSGLHSLSLFRTRVSDAGLAHVQTLKGLEHLTLGGGLITDRGCSPCGGCATCGS